MSGVRALNDVRSVIVPNFRDVDDTGSTVRTVTSNGLFPGPFHRVTGAEETVANAPGSRLDFAAVSDGTMRCGSFAVRAAWLSLHPTCARAATLNAASRISLRITELLRCAQQPEPAA